MCCLKLKNTKCYKLINIINCSPYVDHPITNTMITMFLRIVIKSSPAEDSSLLVVHSPSPPPSLDNILHLPESKPSPFASKRVMYESQEVGFFVN